MNIDVNSLLVAFPAVIVAAITGWVTFKGTKENSRVTLNENLIKGQAARIDKLESRLEDVESSLQETRALLLAEEDRSHSLRLALREALEALKDFVEWARSDRHSAPPTPDVDGLAQVLRSSYLAPTARNPPGVVDDSER